MIMILLIITNFTDNVDQSELFKLLFSFIVVYIGSGIHLASTQKRRGQSFTLFQEGYFTQDSSVQIS